MGPLIPSHYPVLLQVVLPLLGIAFLPFFYLTNAFSP